MPILESLGLKILFEAAKQIASALPRSVDKFRFRRFFGPSALDGANIFAVVDPYTHPEPRIRNRFIKKFLGRKPDQPLVGESDVLGVNVVRLVAYSAGLFSRFRSDKSAIPVVTDSEVAARWDATFIAFGGADSNIKTFDIQNLPEQVYYRTVYGGNGIPRWEVGGRVFGISGGRDYGILLRMQNPYHPEHILFVCAGLGEWGTTGSAYYLFNRWKQVYATHKQASFCKVIEVTFGSDQSAREVFTVTGKGGAP